MNNFNSSQVKSTNDASTVSKYSAVCKNYFKDDFIKYFVNKKKSRASLIHLGYYTRAVILNKLVTQFIEILAFQKVLKVISCGAGFDTTYWRLSEADLLTKNSIFIEIDFPSVIQRKIMLINESEMLKSYICKVENKKYSNQINQMHNNFFLLEVDLCDVNLIEKLFSEIHVDFNIPTLFLSECVITYMKENNSSQFIQWMATKFKNCAFINYEQIHPNDGFGKVMLKHFDKLQSSLFSVWKYPDCESHYLRYKNHGFEISSVLSEWDALTMLTSEDERKTAFNLELFDEFEEFHLKCTHYVIGMAGNQTLSSWISSFDVFNYTKDERKPLKWHPIECDIELNRHSSFCFGNNIYLLGGSNRQSRSSKVYKVTFTEVTNIKLDNITDCCKLKLDSVYGTVSYFQIDKTYYICMYGGRTSPDKISNNGSAVVLEMIGDTLSPKLIISEGNPIPRYRSPMVCLNLSGSTVHCCIFGGRTTGINNPLSDLCELILSHDKNGHLSHLWRFHKGRSDNWPSGRASHGFVACQKRSSLFLSCGLNTETSEVLNDLWKWCCKSETWEKLALKGKLLPRYGHTSHLIDDELYLIGGVNTLSGLQPGLAKINLNELTVTEFSMKSLSDDPVLFFNHTSEVISDEDDSEIWVIGGGGNCFSFGTYFNRGIQRLMLSQLKNSI